MGRIVAIGGGDWGQNDNGEIKWFRVRKLDLANSERMEKDL